jgi:hypothetical protein
MDLEKVVRELADKKAIEDLITWRFARAVDWIDVDAAKACFHPDGRFAYDAVDMNAHDFCEAFGKGAAALKMRSHFIGCAAVALNGDQASGETYAIFAATRDNAAAGRLEDYVVSCRYLTEIERRDGVWRMTSMRIVFDWSFGQPTPEKTPSGNTYNYGLDINHPLYRRLDPNSKR